MHALFSSSSLPILPSFRKQQMLLELKHASVVLTSTGVCSASLKYHCPEGIYLTLSANDSASWLGVYFVREGAYAPAILRFEMTFPSTYPDTPPNVMFSSEIFHPLLIPLTTYTFSAGAVDPSATISASEGERLPPGSLSLVYGFPQWKPEPERGRSNTKEISGANGGVGSNSDRKQESMEDHAAKSTTERIPPTAAILNYIKSAFEDAAMLDRLPLEAAGNQSAWHAWRSHRGLPKQPSRSSSPVPSTSRGGATSSRNPADWNWDGLWEARVRTGIEESISDAQLFGSKIIRNITAVNDPIRFVRFDDEKLEAIQTDMMKLHGFEQTPITR